MGRQQGVTEAKLTNLAAFESSDVYSAEEVLVLRYAVEMTKTPVDVPDALFDELKGRFSEKQLVELTSCIAWENYRARFDHAFGIESQGFSDGAFCPLPERGSSFRDTE